MFAFWNNARARAWFFQALMLVGLVALVAWICGNTATNMAARGIHFGFDFLAHPAHFPISESILSYNADDSFAWAYVVGAANTLFLSGVVIFWSTIFGLLLGLARRARHPLLSRLAAVYVLIVRNVPLIVQLLFWYALTTTIFPNARQALNPLPHVFLSRRGIYVPSVDVDGGWVMVASFVVLAALAALIRRLVGRHGLGVPLAVGFIGALFVGVIAGGHVSLDSPRLVGFNFEGGTSLSPEFSAIFIGLTLYTTAFIGEIIRSGISAIRPGQWEAAQALGLKPGQVLRYVILPQSLRVIIPPLTSQYQSTVKNTTLALAVGYPELGLVMGTVINQTGQAIESILVTLAVFLSISLSLSLFMNWYNARVALVER